jgi:hypothetical protein
MRDIPHSLPWEMAASFFSFPQKARGNGSREIVAAIRVLAWADSAFMGENSLLLAAGFDLVMITANGMLPMASDRWDRRDGQPLAGSAWLPARAGLREGELYYGAIMASALQMNPLRREAVSIYFLTLIIFGIPFNFYGNRYYASSVNIGEWLISYAGGFVRRGLPGTFLHAMALSWQIQPIHVIWVVSLLAYVLFAALLWHFCRQRIDTVLLLSPMILLGPIIENFLVKKDVLVVALYALCLLALQLSRQKRVLPVPTAVAVNVISVFALLIHESYGFWALPSLILIFTYSQSSNGRSIRGSLLAACRDLSPSIVSFLLCLVFKGTPDHAFIIHESWQDLARSFPSMAALLAKAPPHGSIDALGWTTLQGMNMSYSILTGFSYLVWIPAAWLLTIYACMRLFIGDNNKPDADPRRAVILFQFLTVIPLFILGSDFGRWIFLWIASSALFYGFLASVGQLDALKLLAGLRVVRLSQNVIPGIELRGPSQLGLIFFGIPMCCWSLGFFWLSMPLGYTYLLLKTVREVFLGVSA